MVEVETSTRMKAIVCAKPGDIRLSETDRPAVTDDGVLVHVHASSANPVDLFPTTFAGWMMGGRKASVLGADFAGTVEAVGRNVTRFQPGDAVFGGGRGCYAEYKLIPANAAIAHKPAGITFAQAGTVSVAATTALQALRDHGQIKPGQKVLINGASGGVGTFAVQIARALGGKVTAVCSTRNVEMVTGLGAERVIDYRKQDFSRAGERYDLMLDIAGGRSWPAVTRVLEPGGTYVGVGAAAVQHSRAGLFKVLGQLLGVRTGSMFGRRRAVTLFIANLNHADMEYLADLLASGKVTPVIERTYPLAQAPEALAYLNEGHARAKIAIEI
ncbi:MAG TPA: NAD(P)-dependent alcohol dehydrogenase [Candidatus Dormibacteraeota bacterium]|nr:NAD(P)-dependent alcohol dehydrogenase [Candidatus Dormibacteraeota bacterium]